MNPGADNRSDAEMAVQFERIIRKVKGSMRYRGSFSIELIEMAELRQWVESRVADLEAGTCDTRVVIPLAQPSQVGRILRLHLAGQTQRQIADAMAVSIGLVNKRIAEGTNYLIVLQGIESGLGIA